MQDSAVKELVQAARTITAAEEERDKEVKEKMVCHREASLDVFIGIMLLLHEGKVRQKTQDKM